jgi:hypothetical protein
MPADKPCTLYTATLNLLHQHARSLVDIHKESGVPFYWLKKFSAGEVKDPSVNRVQKLSV